MSHIAEIKLEIRDLDALERAAQRLGMEMVRDKKTYKWYGRTVGGDVPEGFKESDLGKCDHVLRIPGSRNAYEIGVVPSRTGEGYTLLWDSWQGGYGLTSKVGGNGGLLKQSYATEVAMKEALREGWRIQESKNEDGAVMLQLTR